MVPAKRICSLDRRILCSTDSCLPHHFPISSPPCANSASTIVDPCGFDFVAPTSQPFHWNFPRLLQNPKYFPTWVCIWLSVTLALYRFAMLTTRVRLLYATPPDNCINTNSISYDFVYTNFALRCTYLVISISHSVRRRQRCQQPTVGDNLWFFSGVFTCYLWLF